MPRVDIWIRKDDWAKWKAIKNKPEWLHEHLNVPGIISGVALEDMVKGEHGIVYTSLTKTTYPKINEPTIEPLEESA